MSSLTLSQFAEKVPVWYDKYRCSKYFYWHQALERRLHKKAQASGCLDLDDLVEIAEWGGKQHGIHKSVTENADDEVRAATRAAFQNRRDPSAALGSVLGLKHWGLTYASKTLMFMWPSDYGALDSKIRTAARSLLPRIRDGDTRSMIRGYVCFLELCKSIQTSVKMVGPRDGQWFIADVESALFQFAYEKKELVWDGGYRHHSKGGR